MLKSECVCFNCKKTIQAYQDSAGKVVPGQLVFDFLNKRIVYICPECGYENIMELGDIEKAVKKSKTLPRLRFGNF